jgi:hypothetical protein
MSGMDGQLAGEVGAKQPRSGCWLWGLVIGGAVLGLVMILAVLMFARIKVFHTKLQSSPEEQKDNLNAIFVMQKDYYGEHNTYAGGKVCFDLVGGFEQMETQYNYYCGDTVLPCTKPGCDRCLTTELPGKGAKSSKKSFTAYAVGNIDGDSSCDVWSIRDNRELRNDYNDIGD